MAIGTFVWKVASRCSLNCSYCYVYNGGDSTWRQQPALMSPGVARQAARRVREYCDAHALPEVVVNFHGGEPLLGGVPHLAMVTAALRGAFAGSETRVSTAVQTNALHFTAQVGDFLLEEGLGVYVSLDGPPEVNDRHRLDRRGRPSSSRVEEGLALLTAPPYRDAFCGFLCVVDPDSDPEAVVRYLLGYAPPSLDFLLPLYNHDTFPPERRGRCGEWLVRAFDAWFDSGTRSRVRGFDRILATLCRLPGAGPLAEGRTDAVIVETNGAIEADDTLKTAYHGAAALGCNVFDHGFDAVADHPAVRRGSQGVESLAAECRACPVVRVCGGGHVSHRYGGGSFDRPSVYCGDLQRIIGHAAGRLRAQLRAASPALAATA